MMEIVGPSRRGKYIYQILNVETGAAYIGSTAATITYRANDHKNALLNGTHRCRLMQDEWDQYGADAFWASILEEVPPGASLRTREEYWIETFLRNGICLYNNARANWTRLRCDRCSDPMPGGGRARYCVACKLKAARSRQPRPLATGDESGGQ